MRVRKILIHISPASPHHRALGLNNAFQCKQSVEDEMLTEQKYLSIFVFFLRRNSAVLDLLFKLSLDGAQPHTYLITD